ncbi:MAG TPA: hypothetical protein VFE79_06365 [Paraburkholderia sp.]|nr:hypothetical protein [Paraburkholderia sp.]
MDTQAELLTRAELTVTTDEPAAPTEPPTPLTDDDLLPYYLLTMAGAY